MQKADQAPTEEAKGFDRFFHDEDPSKADPDSRSVQHTSWTPEGEIQPERNFSVVSEERVIEAISSVYDPEIPVNIYELGLIYTIDLYDNGKVKVTMTLTAPGCPSAQELPVQVKEALEHLEEVVEAEVEVVWDPPWDMSRMSEDARLALNMF
ncbi:SUF system Fe-S cluster assembly protein [Entomobacter blattae]